MEYLQKLRVEEVAIFVGVSVNTLNSWYRFKKQFPDDEFAKMLPCYTQEGGDRGIRLWNEKDVDRLIEFKRVRPTGRNGVMGKVTQKYVKNKKEN